MLGRLRDQLETQCFKLLPLKGPPTTIIKEEGLRTRLFCDYERWYHPELTRHQAEAELANCDEGIYLLRPCNQSDRTTYNFSLDLKCSHTVKHFKVKVSPEGIEFGQEIFFNLDSFQHHFDNCPLIGDDTGRLYILKYPYPRDVDEIHDYQLITEHFLSNDQHPLKSPDAQAHSLVSKEGYLVKLGAIVKSWKERWFVLKNNELRYYRKESDMQPIRTINLQECSEVGPCQIQNRKDVFKLTSPERVFYLQAPNADIMNDWVRLLQWKMDELKGSVSDKLPCTQYDT